jgi:outer membrane protein assembly factor BamB
MALRNWLLQSICLTLGILLISDSLVGDDWPQWRGPQRDGVWRETGIIDKFASEQIPLAWKVKVGPGYSGPTVADGRVFLTDRLVEPEQVERIHCFDEKTGVPVWQVSYSAEYSIGYKAGPRAAVTVHQGRALALGAMGHLHCLDAATGTIHWVKDLNQDYQIVMPIWGIAAAPLVVGDTVILHIGGKDACIVALDLESGEQRWTALNDRASYSSPVMVQQAGTPVVICWTGDSVSGLAPDTGKVHWRHPFPPSRMPIGIATPVVHGPDVFLTSFYDGSMMLRLDQKKLAVNQLWRKVGGDERNTIGLHSIISTPIRLEGHLYGVDSYGELRCLDAATGARIWEDQTATPKARWSTIHFVQNKDRVWMFNERGELIIARLSPQGFEEISRAKLIEPTLDQLNRRNGVCWAHPAFANRHVLIRNDNELVSASLAKK